MGFLPDIGNILSGAGDSLGGLGNIQPTLEANLNSLRYGFNTLRNLSFKGLLNGTAFPHTYKSGARIKGYLIDAETSEMRKFQYNPQTMEYERSANYAEIKSPGMQYPLIYFVNGNAKNFTVELFLYDRPSTGKILKDVDWLESFLPAYNNTDYFRRPHPIIFAYGGFVAKCIVLAVKPKYDEYDERNGEPYMAHVMVDFKVVDMPKKAEKKVGDSDGGVT